MKPQFKLIDFFQVAPDRSLSNLSSTEKVKYIDSLMMGEEKKGGLSISWYLSHSGRRINNRIYTVKGQQDGVHSIMSPYAKPILQHHNQDTDPIGRFTGGRWESLASEAMSFFPSLSEYMDLQLAFDRDDPEMIFSLMNKNNLLTNRSWSGMGRMNVSAKISDPVAIEKFLDGRYITFSAGSTTDRHVCSICQSDWAVGDFCEHRHGKMYDGVPCCFITGKFEVLEGSVVNTPADDLSQLNSMEMTDSAVDFQPDSKVDPSTFYFSDSIYGGSDHETHEARPEANEAQDHKDHDGQEEEEDATESILSDGSEEKGLQQEVLTDKEYDHMLRISSSQMEELHNSGMVDIPQSSGDEKMIIRVVYEGAAKRDLEENARADELFEPSSGDSISYLLEELLSDEKKFKVPSGARGNARKVLEWKKKYGSDVKGMTAVGWARARQLASQSEIPLSTVKRMAAFNRHRKNAAVDPKFKSEPWKDRGYVAWLGWGGTSGIDWAIKISAANDSLELEGDYDADSYSSEVEPSSDAKRSSPKGKGAKTPAKPSERIKGSKKNKEGSASKANSKIEVGSVLENLKEKVSTHNKKYGKEKGKRVTLGMLKAVYRRGAGAFSSTHRPGMSRSGWGVARVNAFLKLVRSGRPSNPKYKQDNDLLPAGHPRKSSN